MIKTGQLKVSGNSVLNGTTLARAGEGDPLGAATNFLADRGLGNNDFIRVNGSDGFVGNMPVFFITSAGPLVTAMAAKKVAKKAGKKSGGKKGGAKKASSKKSGGRASAKRSAKKTATKKSKKGSRKRQ